MGESTNLLIRDTEQRVVDNEHELWGKGRTPYKG